MTDDIEAIAELGGAAAIEMVASSLIDHGEHAEKCANCTAPMIGAYCAACGQERYTSRRSLWQLLRHFGQELASFDSKTARTAAALLLKPGELPKAFREGRTRPYTPALRLYLFVSLIFFLILSATGIALVQFEIVATPVKITKAADGNYYIANPAFDPSDPDTRQFQKLLEVPKEEATRPGGIYTFSTRTHFFSRIGAYPSKLSPAARKQLETGETLINVNIQTAGKNPSKAEIEKAKRIGKSIRKNLYGGLSRLVANPAAMNGPLTTWIPRALFLLLPLYALLLALFYVRHRKHFYFVDHLVFSLNVHTFAFVLLIVDIGLAQIFPGESVFELTMLALGIYLLLAFRCFYGQSWLWTVIKFASVSIVYSVFILAPALAGLMTVSFLGGSFG